MTASAVRAAFAPALRHHDVLEGKLDLLQRYPETNLIAIGPSYVEMGINPDVFDAAMKAHGFDIHSANMGIAGLSLPEMRWMLEQALERRPCCIKYVILSPCYECLNIAKNPDSARSFSFFDLRRGLAFARYLSLYEKLPDDKVGKPEYIKNIGISAFRHYSNAGVGAAVVGLSQFIVAEQDDMLSPAYWNEHGTRGFRQDAHAMGPDEARSYEAGLSAHSRRRAAYFARSAHVFVSDEMFDQLLETLAFLKRKHVLVLVVTPPNQWEWEYHADVVAHMQKTCGLSSAFIDFTDVDRWPALFLPTSIRLDDAHMNALGATRWSRVLADEVSGWIPRGRGSCDSL